MTAMQGLSLAWVIALAVATYIGGQCAYECWFVTFIGLLGYNMFQKDVRR